MLRTHCFGSCPVYAVTVFDDGEVTWEGIDNVRTPGPASTRVSVQDAQRMQARFHALAAAQPDLSTTYATDHPSVVLEDGSRRVVHDYGASREAHPGVTKLAEDLDALVRSEQWIEEGCAGLSSVSVAFGDGLEFEVRELAEQALSTVAKNFAENPGRFARVRGVATGPARQRAELIESALEQRGIARSGVVLRLLDPGLDGPEGWDDDSIWIDYGPAECFSG